MGIRQRIADGVHGARSESMERYVLRACLFLCTSAEVFRDSLLRSVENHSGNSVDKSTSTCARKCSRIERREHLDEVYGNTTFGAYDYLQEQGGGKFAKKEMVSCSFQLNFRNGRRGWKCFLWSESPTVLKRKVHRMKDIIVRMRFV